MSMPVRAAVLALFALAGTAASAGPPGPLQVVRALPGPDGGWDYASFDAAHGRVYVAHGMKVMAIDAAGGRVNPDFAAGNQLHSVLPIPGSDLVVTTNSGDDTARILDSRDGRLIASVATAKDPDAAIWNGAGRQVLVMGHESGTITLVDPQAGKATGSILVGGALEFPALDGHGRLFVNREDHDDIVVIDMAARRVVATWPLAGCHGPTGLAYVEGARLVSACVNGVAKVLDAADGRDLATLSIGQGADAVIYDAARHQALIPCGRSGVLAVVALAASGGARVVASVPTQIGARTGALDPLTGRLWLPTATYLPPAAPNQRPTVKPGSFRVLVLERR
jgi:hypothetical protein